MPWNKVLWKCGDYVTRRQKSFFNAAKAVSQMSTFERVHIGCVVTEGNRIISSGYNSMRTHPVQKALDKERFEEDTPHRLHAESMALIPLMNKKDINFKKCDIYVYRECKNGQLANCRPCPSCEKLIRDLGIRRIYYTTTNGFAEERWN